MLNSIDWNQIRKANMIDPYNGKTGLCYSKRDCLRQTKELFDDVKAYFQYRYTLHIADGIVFLHDKIVVPIGLRQVFLQKIHDAHLGVVKSRLLRQTLMYRPNLNHDVETMCQTCESMQKEPIYASKYS